MRYLSILLILGCLAVNYIIFTDYRDQQQRLQDAALQHGDAALTLQKGNRANSRQQDSRQAADAAVQLSRGEQVDTVSPVQEHKKQPQVHKKRSAGGRMRQPDFYRGIYLHNHSARVFKRLQYFVKEMKKHSLNVAVLDLQDAVRFRTYMVPKANVQYCITNGIYPVARIVVFPYGLKRYPVERSYLEQRFKLAERAARAGFPEVQFDYIRFADSNRLSWVSRKKRYQLIEGFLREARSRLKKYGVKVSADVFGRVALNRNDKIGQRLEGLDHVVDVICPMVYPSHFGWSKRMMANPFYTVRKSAHVARKRLKKAGLVMYIQGFIMRVRYSGMTLEKYIAEQVRACEQAGVKGFIVWNAAQRYQPTFDAMKMHYNQKKKIRRNPARQTGTVLLETKPADGISG